MPLPTLIEIEPLIKPVTAQITVPGSKSITNRALILAALADGERELRGALWSEDTQVMVEALRKLGFAVRVEPDPDEFCNRTIRVNGLAGVIPNAGREQDPVELFVGNAGTAARFLAALLCLGHGAYRLSGVPRMHDRPQAALFQALRSLGYRIDSPNDRLPAVIHGAGPKAGLCRVSIEESSQFASALLLCAQRGGWQIEVTGENAEESPYVALTLQLAEVFQGYRGSFQIEPDASSGSYFLAASWLQRQSEFHARLVEAPADSSATAQARRIQPGGMSSISVRHWPSSGWQVDADLSQLIFAHQPVASSAPEQGGASTAHVNLALPQEISRRHDLGDSIMTVAILALFNGAPVRLTDLGRLRLQETERVVALRTELTRCGAKVLEDGDTLTVFPAALHGAEIETYDDHRIAMCFAILGLKVPGIKIKNPACVKKTFPNFFQKLAEEPPQGLGVTILDTGSGKRLTPQELFAG